MADIDNEHQSFKDIDWDKAVQRRTYLGPGWSEWESVDIYWAVILPSGHLAFHAIAADYPEISWGNVFWRNTPGQ